MNKTNTRAMVETAFVSTIVAMLTIIGAVMPFSAFLATMVAPAGISIMVSVGVVDIAVLPQ